MVYSFDGEIARKYGVNEAVFVHNLYWWIAKNEANGRHYYDGKSWTYNSMAAFAKLFPFWSKDQIRRMIEKLRSNGAIYTGNFNKAGFDRTQWYALSESITAYYQNCQMQMANLPNGNGENATPIPDINTDIKPDIEEIEIHKCISTKKSFIPPAIDEIRDYCKQRKNNVDPQKFLDYFTADPDKQWIDSEGKPVKSWKQKIITWEGRNKKKEEPQSAVDKYGRLC